MSDQEAPVYTPRQQRLLTNYERQQEASNFAGSIGQSRRKDRFAGRASQTLARLTNQGIDTSGLDIADFSGEYNPYDASNAISALSGDAARRAQGAGGDFDRVRNRTQVELNNANSGLLESRGLDARQSEFDQNILPTYSGAMDRMNELAGTNAISAEQESLLRSKIAATNRTAASSNLGRVSSALGLRGMSDSPAAAALASSVAQDYDIDLQNQLSDMGFKVDQMNREQARQDSTAAASLATLRINAENAYLSKDTEAVQSIGRDTAALIDALYSRDQAMDLMEKQVHDAGQQSFGDRLNSWTDTASNVAGLVSSVYTGGLVGGGKSGGARASGPTTSTQGVPLYEEGL